MTLKAGKDEDLSDGIVVSFYAKWQPLLMAGKVSCVFRKRAPQHMVPRWIYAYFGTPIKAVAGRLSVQKVEAMPVAECLHHTSAGAIARDELAQYAHNYSSLFVFWVYGYQPANQEASFDHLSSLYGFAPPQSFLLLSTQGKTQLDELCGFEL